MDHSLNIGELLDNSRKGLRHLVLTYQDLSAWMDGMEQYLARRKVLPVHMEKLLRQMDELAVSIVQEVGSWFSFSIFAITVSLTRHWPPVTYEMLQKCRHLPNVTFGCASDNPIRNLQGRI